MWVLLTTQFPEMVEPNERVVVDELNETEAEDVNAAKEVLKIEEAKMGPDDLVALGLFELGVWMWRVQQFEEAEYFLRRALKIEEAKFGADDPKVAITRFTLGMFEQETRRPVEAEASFARALQVLEVELGADENQIAMTLGDLDRCKAALDGCACAGSEAAGEGGSVVSASAGDCEGQVGD